MKKETAHAQLPRLTLSRGAAGTLGGLAAGAVYIVAQVTLSALVQGGSAAAPVERIAAMLMGSDAAPPGAGFSFTVLGMAAIIHFALSITFGQLVSSLVWHRRARAALLVGALTGVALYGLNFEIIAPLAFPWFEDSVTWVSLADHALFGMVAAAVCLALRGNAAQDAPQQAAAGGTTTSG
jgi:hypothetical protein